MKEYCKSEDKCRRKLLLQNFIGGIDTTTVGNVKHNCCDFCTRECMCTAKCPVRTHLQQSTCTSDDDDTDEEEFVRIVTQAQRDLLRTRLMEFRDMVLHSTREQCEGMSTYVGFDIVSGLPSEMIDSVVDNCEFVVDSFDVEEKCLVWNWAGEIFRIIEDVLG